MTQLNAILNFLIDSIIAPEVSFLDSAEVSLDVLQHLSFDRS